MGIGTIYVDLDGTLARYDSFEGHDKIGEPITHIVKFITDAVSKGWKIKIFTARANYEPSIKYIRDWLIRVFGRQLGTSFEITNIKGADGTMFLDDRAFKITKNAGCTCCLDSSVEMYEMMMNAQQKG